MENSPQKRLTPRLLLIILGFVIVVGGMFLFLQTSSQSKPASQIPSPNAQRTQILPTTPPDKQISGQIVVKFKASYSATQITEHIKIYDATISKKIEGINYTVLKVPAGQENIILEKMKSDPFVEKALPDFTNHTTFVPNDPNFTLQYGLHNIGQSILNVSGKVNADINIESAWDVTKGNGIKVAILDSGIDLTHPELASKVIAQKQFSTSAIDSAIQDKNGHGTHVAGIVAAITDNSQGVAGTCPGCQLIIGKVVTNDASGNATGATSDIVSGITWAADQGAKVINLSLRTTTAGSAPLYQSAIDYANTKNAVVVVAAGNDASNAQVWPAANTGVVSVAATDNNDNMASFSNYGSFVRVAAPGVNIVSTLPTTANAKNVLNYGYLSGTSMASPLVSGVIALIWSTPYGTSNTAVINRLYATSDKIAGTGTNWTEGRINAGRAVGAVLASPTPSPTTSAFPSPQCVGGVGIPPCATIAPSSGPNRGISPTIFITHAAPTITVPVTSNTPLTPAPTLPVANDNPGTNPSSPCPALDKFVFNTASVADEKHGRGHHKHHTKTHHNNQGLLSKLLALILKLLEQLFQLFGLGNPCDTTPSPITPTLTISPSETITPINTVDPSITSEPATTIEPGISDSPAIPDTSINPTQGVTVIPPASGQNVKQ